MRKQSDFLPVKGLRPEQQILDNYNAEILKHTCDECLAGAICKDKRELIEKRNKVFRLLRDELKEIDPGSLITSVNDKKPLS